MRSRSHRREEGWFRRRCRQSTARSPRSGRKSVPTRSVGTRRSECRGCVMYWGLHVVLLQGFQVGDQVVELFIAQFAQTGDAVGAVGAGEGFAQGLGAAVVEIRILVI